LCQVLLSTDVGEDTECHAAKLLEIILLQFKGSIDHVSIRFVIFTLHFLSALLKQFFFGGCEPAV